MIPTVKISSRLKFCIWTVTLCVWLAEALAARGPLDADAISYLNIAHSCLGGNWHALVNGWWSPGYPFLLTIWLKIFHPSVFQEARAMHLFAFFSLLVALLSFEYFLSVFQMFCKQREEQEIEAKGEALSEDAVWLMGYSLFFWITTFFTPPSLEQPDILVFILYLIASALCVQLSYRQEWWRYALLGLVLGLGYLVKAVMLPIGFVFLFALFCQKGRWTILPRLVLSTAIFVAVSLPFCLELSRSKGHFTFSDVGTLAYRHVMGFDVETQPPSAASVPAATPHVADYSSMIQLGTYPPWADPSYGFKGAPFRFDFRRQVERTHVVLRGYFDIYVVRLGALFCGLLVLVFLGEVRLFASRFLRQVVLWLPAVAGLAFYATMRFDDRFLAGYTIALFAACIASLRIGELPGKPNLAGSVALAVSSVLFVQAAVQAGHEGIKLLRQAQHADWQVADALHRVGIKPEDRVSYMGYTLGDHSWAYVAGTRIVAEIPEEDVSNFWAAGNARRAEVLRWIESTGAKALVTHEVPEMAMPMGWRRVGDTDYYILAFSETPRSTQ